MAGNPEWLAKVKEEALEPELPIIDPHHHLWDHPTSRYELDEIMADIAEGHPASSCDVVRMLVSCFAFSGFTIRSSERAFSPMIMPS